MSSSAIKFSALKHGAVCLFVLLASYFHRFDKIFHMMAIVLVTASFWKYLYNIRPIPSTSREKNDFEDELTGLSRPAVLRRNSHLKLVTDR